MLCRYGVVTLIQVRSNDDQTSGKGRAEEVSGHKTFLHRLHSHSLQFGFSRHYGIISDGEIQSWRGRDSLQEELDLLNSTFNLA